MNGSEEDVRPASPDNDNERVREKLKKTTIAPGSRPASALKNVDDGDETMESTGSPTEDSQRKTRKRSHDESDEEKEGDEESERRRVRVHERKRSREITEADRLTAGTGLERVKTPPTHSEEAQPIAERVSSPRSTIERKRSLGKIDTEGEEADQKTKISKTDEERRKKKEESDAAGEKADSDTKESKSDSKAPEGSGFANTSAKSPFATAASGSSNIFGNASSSSLFASSKFGALSGSSVSPFGTLGSKTAQSPFGALGAKTAGSAFGAPSAFGAKPTAFGGSTFGSGGSPVKSQTGAKAFGAPAEEEKEDGGESGSEQEDKGKTTMDDTGAAKLLGLKEQEVVTGEEDETTIYKCTARVFIWDTSAKQWKERGRGVLKVNRTTPSVGDFGLASDDEDDQAKSPPKKSARLIMRTDGTYVVILNTPIYKEMKLDEPKSNVLNLLAQDNGTMTSMTIRVRNNTIAKELHKHIEDLRKEIWG